jgi:hypothetical protein
LPAGPLELISEGPPFGAPDVLASDDEPEGPTFGPPHDQTHAKRKGAAKKR